jgi:glycosyltransferase involved in cell wall biosynthesis
MQTKAKKEIKSRTTETPYPIIVHCHLCWDWVWQRPQQFMSRFGKIHPVLFVETHAPSADLDQPRTEIKSTQFPNVTVLQVKFPTERWHDGGYVDQERRRLVKEALAGLLRGRFEAPVHWFYDPMAVPAFAGHLGERAIVYDCMDELSRFKGAPDGLIEREHQLLALADIVFTGGRGMYQSKSRRNPNCHFYGCGVDVQHFGRARLPETPLPADLERIPGPRLGYFGVVDERIDYELLDRLAVEHPAWSVVMVGPTAKVDPADFPRHENLFWLGGRPYAELPNYTKGFDACLMPFALNDATQFINPTKALEYMAAGRPIVSTAVPDVVANFSTVAQVAQSPNQFIRFCEEAIRSPDVKRIEEGLRMAEKNTWESIVAEMEYHIKSALARKERTSPSTGQSIGNSRVETGMRPRPGLSIKGEPCLTI